VAARASVEAIEEVYRRRGDDFFRFAVARLRDPALAQDAVQDGFANALRARRSFRGTGPLDAWIARCVLNAAEDLRRRRRPLEPVEPAPDPTAPDENVRAAIRALPERQRDALFLRHYLDLEYAAIAEALGVEIGTVSATLNAARAGLARALSEEVAL
jgi:RNA polymerase sigma factor (sigma-70 family)